MDLCVFVCAFNDEPIRLTPLFFFSLFLPPSLAPSPSVKVNGCLMDPLPPPTVLRKSSTSSPSNMMETSIDEGIETEEPDCEDDPPHLLSAYQTARFGQRRHTLSEVTNQPGPSSQGTQTHPEMHLNEGRQTIEFFKSRLSSEIP